MAYVDIVVITMTRKMIMKICNFSFCREKNQMATIVPIIKPNMAKYAVVLEKINKIENTNCKIIAQRIHPTNRNDFRSINFLKFSL